MKKEIQSNRSLGLFLALSAALGAVAYSRNVEAGQAQCDLLRGRLATTYQQTEKNLQELFFQLTSISQNVFDLRRLASHELQPEARELMCHSIDSEIRNMQANYANRSQEMQITLSLARISQNAYFVKRLQISRSFEARYFQNDDCSFNDEAHYQRVKHLQRSLGLVTRRSQRITRELQELSDRFSCDYVVDFSTAIRAPSEEQLLGLSLAL